MDWGIQNRLNRLIQKDGKALFLPIDHGYFQGPTSKLEKPGETIKPLIPFAGRIASAPTPAPNPYRQSYNRPVEIQIC